MHILEGSCQEKLADVLYKVCRCTDSMCSPNLLHCRPGVCGRTCLFFSSLYFTWSEQKLSTSNQDDLWKKTMYIQSSNLWFSALLCAGKCYFALKLTIYASKIISNPNFYFREARTLVGSIPVARSIFSRRDPPVEWLPDALEAVINDLARLIPYTQAI